MTKIAISPAPALDPNPDDKLTTTTTTDEVDGNHNQKVNECKNEQSPPTIQGQDQDLTDDFKTTTKKIPGVADSDDEPFEQTWHKKFALITFPFLLLGFPVHCLIGECGEPKWNWTQWLRELFLPAQKTKLFLTLPLLAFTSLVLGFTLKALWRIFYKLLIVGKIDWELILDFITMFRMVPAVLPLVAIWVYGHTTRNLISSFDLSRDGFRKYMAAGVGGRAKLTKPEPLGLRLSLMFFTICCTHTIPLLINSEMRSLLIHWVELMYSLVLPFYYMFVFGLKSQFQLMNSFMGALVVENERPSLERLAQVKELYKRIVRGVVFVNDVFGYYLSWVIPAYAWTIGAHVFLTLLYFMGFMTTESFFGIVSTFQLNSPVMVRIIVAYMFLVGLYLGFVGYILWEAIVANDESRYAQILITDYLLDRDRDPPALLVQTDEVYKSARHLKYLLTSTSTKGHNPALLRIYICGYVPWLNRRLHSQQLENVILHGRFLKEIV